MFTFTHSNSQEALHPHRVINLTWTHMLSACTTQIQAQLVSAEEAARAAIGPRGGQPPK